MLLYLAPFWVDFLAWFLWEITGSASVVSTVVRAFDFGVVLCFLMFGWRPLVNGVLSANKLFFFFILLQFVVAAIVFVRAPDNAEYVIASGRLGIWVLALLGMRDAGLIRPWSRVIDSARHAAMPVAVIVATLCLLQVVFSDSVSPYLQEFFVAVLPDGKTNAVLTSISLQKSFASLWSRNPIELGYIGLFILCFALDKDRRIPLLIAGILIIACSRSNTLLMSAFVVVAYFWWGRLTKRPGLKWLSISLVTSGLLVFVAYLPEIYVSSEATWDELIQVLAQQRLGMVLSLPLLLQSGGMDTFLFGTPQSLEASVSSLYNTGGLPDLFAEGGAVAVFDVMWLGMYLVGGGGYVLAVVGYLAWSFVKARKAGAGSGRTLALYLLGGFVVSFSSQVFMSKYYLWAMAVMMVCMFDCRDESLGAAKENV